MSFSSAMGAVGAVLPYRRAASAALVAFILLSSRVVPAGAVEDYTLTLSDHAFVEGMLSVPARTAFTLRIVNEDAAAEEFESGDLHVEKLVPGHGAITLRIGALKPGVYTFFGDFHRDSAYGQMIAGETR